MTNSNDLTYFDRLMSAYNALAEFFEKKYDCDKHSFTAAVGKVSAQNPAVKKYKHSLVKFADLRNAIVHHANPKEAIAIPTLKYVEEFEKIAKTILLPKGVFDICIKNLKIFNESDSVFSAVEEMHKNDFSQIIVKTDSGHTLFTGESLIRILKFASESINLSKISLGSLTHNNTNHLYHTFISREASIYEAQQLFLNQFENGTQTRLYALLVTQSGKKSEKPIGLVTPWDLISPID